VGLLRALRHGSRRAWRPAKDHRLVLDGIFWIARTGAQWRDLHEHFGKWSSVYRQFRRWTLSGLWELLLEALNETEGVGETVQRSTRPLSGRITAPPALKGDSASGSWALKRWRLHDEDSPPHER